MINVEPWIGFPTVCNKVYETLESRLFVLAVKSPFSRISRSAVSTLVVIAEQVLEPVFSDKGVAFEIEENVAVIWFRQRLKVQARAGPIRPQSAVRRPVWRWPEFELGLARAHRIGQRQRSGFHGIGFGSSANAARVLMSCETSSAIWP